MSKIGNASFLGLLGLPWVGSPVSLAVKALHIDNVASRRLKWCSISVVWLQNSLWFLFFLNLAEKFRMFSWYALYIKSFVYLYIWFVFIYTVNTYTKICSLLQTCLFIAMKKWDWEAWKQPNFRMAGEDFHDGTLFFGLRMLWVCGLNEFMEKKRSNGTKWEICGWTKHVESVAAGCWKHLLFVWLCSSTLLWQTTRIKNMFEVSTLAFLPIHWRFPGFTGDLSNVLEQKHYIVLAGLPLGRNWSLELCDLQTARKKHMVWG